jgi:hypothetical protein
MLQEAAVSESNPYSPPRVTEAAPRRRKSSIGPLLAGIIAIAVAGSLGGGFGLIVAILGVSSWWGSKFWPRKDESDDAGARAFLARLESTPDAAASPVSPKGEPEKEPGLGALGDIHL